MYHSTAHFYEFFGDKGAEEAKNRIRFLEPFLKNINSVLEIGSGTGSTAFALAEQDKLVTCIEPSEDMQSVFLTKLSAQSKIEDNLSLLPFSASELDLKKRWPLICSFDVFFLITEQEKRISSFQSVANHLESDGLFIFNALNIKAERKDKMFSQIGERKIGDVVYKHFSEAKQMSAKERKVTWVFETWFGEAIIDKKVEEFILRLDILEGIVSDLEKTGLKIVNTYSDLSCNPFTPNSHEMIVVAKH